MPLVAMPLEDVKLMVAMPLEDVRLTTLSVTERVQILRCFKRKNYEKMFISLRIQCNIFKR